MNTKSAIASLLEEITPLEQSKTDVKMILASRIADAMKAKNWKNKDLLAAIGKHHPSVITKWLSGTHNFTVDTLVELENALGISLLKVENIEKEKIVTYHAVARSEVQSPFIYPTFGIVETNFSFRKAFSVENQTGNQA
jgi:transcriptional regulator with XRE-family HTH domain